MVATISPALLNDLRRRGDTVTLIDVRTPAEFGEVHVDFARNIPLDALEARDVAALAGDGPVYVICKSGTRSQKACEKLTAAGLNGIVSVEGGTNACVEAGLPVVRGRKAMSLERQVRIAAGALVALGAATAFGFVRPQNHHFSRQPCRLDRPRTWRASPHSRLPSPSSRTLCPHCLCPSIGPAHAFTRRTFLSSGRALQWPSASVRRACCHLQSCAACSSTQIPQSHARYGLLLFRSQ